MRERVLAALCTGFVGGVFIRSLFDVGTTFPLFLLSLSLSLCAVPFCLPSFRRPSILFLTLFLFGTAAGVFRYALSERPGGDRILHASIGEEVVVRGIVVREPDEREHTTRLTLTLDTLQRGTSTVSVSGKAVVVAPVHPRFRFGDELMVRGELKTPQPFIDDRGRRFDYPAYLAKDSIFYEFLFPEITRTPAFKQYTIIGGLLAAKLHFLEKVRALMPEPHAALLNGILLGAKQSLGKELLSDFQRTGILHIVVLSGYNLTIVAAFFLWLVSWLPRNARLLVAATAIVLFALVTGAGATVVRASIMALLVLLAQATGRSYHITRALFFAGFLMVFENPKVLVFDVSFQLSFLATLALITVVPRIERFFTFFTARFKIREIVVTTVATQLFVLPYLLYLLGELNLVSLPVNLLILPIIPWVMLFGFIAGVLGFVNLLLAAPAAAATVALLSYQLTVVRWFSDLPFASVPFPTLPFIAVIVWYAVYAAVLWGMVVAERKHGTKPSPSSYVSGSVRDVQKKVPVWPP